MQREQVIIVGAGPCGLSAAAYLLQNGVNPLIIEKAAIVNSIYQYPTQLQFFSTPELLEIGGIPFTTPNDKPYRVEALSYYRQVVKHHQIRIHTYEEVVEVTAADEGFDVRSHTRTGQTNHYHADKIILATGYFDNPNRLGILGEQLPKVSHFFREPHPYMGLDVAIIGGSNSAIDAALELTRVDARVTVIYRKSEYSRHIKPWVLPGFKSKVDKGLIRMLFNSRVTRITETAIEVTNELTGTSELQRNDFVFALTGFRPNRQFLAAIGVQLDPVTEKPIVNPDTMETNIPGLYIAGVIASGADANEVFIETGRFHGKLIADHLTISYLQ